MKVTNGLKLANDNGAAVPFRQSPNTSGHFGAGHPKILVMHYTAGSGTAGSIDWLCNPNAPHKPSAHLVIGRDGAITQLMTFDVVANHAGAGTYKGAGNMNGRSIGIELANAGQLVRVGNKWRNGNGVVVADSKVSQARHKFDGEMAGWEMYPTAQMDAAIEAAKAICAHFAITDICGHDDFAAFRGKRDPGPLFPMTDFIENVLGTGDGNTITDGVLEVAAVNGLNLRTGPAVGAAKVERVPNPLPNGTRVRIVEQSGAWSLVHVLDAAGDEVDTGWCMRSFLT